MSFDFNQLVDIWQRSTPPDAFTPPAYPLVPARQAKSWVIMNQTYLPIGSENQCLWRFFLQPDQLFGVQMFLDPNGVYYLGTRYTKSQNFYLYCVGCSGIYAEEPVEVVAWYTVWRIYAFRDTLEEAVP